MWDYIFGLIPEKRQPGAVSVLAFFSITLPIFAAISALAAWKLNDRLGRQRQPATSTGDPHMWTSSVPAETETKKILAKTETALTRTEDTLHKTQDELHKMQEELQHTKEKAAKSLAVAGQRHITPAQKQRFLTVSAARPVGPVGISAIDGDPESKAYAEQIREVLEDAGYDVGDDLGSIKLRKDTLIGLRVGVYSKESAPPHALPLAANFIDADISAFPVINQRIPGGAVEVTVGTNPAAMNDDEPIAAPATAKPAAEDPPPAPTLNMQVATPIPAPVPLPSPTPFRGTPPPKVATPVPMVREREEKAKSEKSKKPKP